MELILLESVEKLGNVGDQVRVKNGYGRNFLIPQGKALRANAANKAVFEAKRADIERENKTKRDQAEKQASTIEGQFIILLRQAGEDGRLYGSVTSRDIAHSLVEKGIEVVRNQITLDNAVKYLGVTEVKCALHPEVIVKFYINVARTEAEASDAKELFLNPPKEEKQEELVEEAVQEEIVEEQAEEEAVGEGS